MPRKGYLQGPAAAVGVFETKGATFSRSKGAAEAVLKDHLRLLLGGAKERDVAHVLGRNDCLRADESDLLKDPALLLLLKEAAVKASDGARLLLTGCGMLPSTVSGHLASTSFNPVKHQKSRYVSGIHKRTFSPTCIVTAWCVVRNIVQRRTLFTPTYMTITAFARKACSAITMAFEAAFVR